jgi:hypothetical protein
MVVGNVANISELQVASVFRIEVYRLVSWCVCITFCFEKEWGKGRRNGDLPFIGQ